MSEEMNARRRRVEVCYTPGQFELYKSDFEICVVIDVLRATSAICTGLAAGVKSIVPVETVEEARSLMSQGLVGAAERNGEIVQGFSMGNSPRAYWNPELVGKSVVLSTTNGTRAIALASKSSQVVIGSLNNLDALCEWLSNQPGHVLLLASGWKDKFNLEDTICAGAIAEYLIDKQQFYCDEDATIAAKFLYRSARENIFSFLKASSHRRRLHKLNLNEDIKYCLTPNTVESVPVLQNGALVDVMKTAENKMDV
jgi:2-phosphosulfolactate phosphatase